VEWPIALVDDHWPFFISSSSVNPEVTDSVAPLAPADRAAFRQAAENALATSSPCWGPGLI
jgi:hypothetical protein